MKILPPVQFLLQESSVNGHRAEEAKRIEHYEGATSWSQNREERYHIYKLDNLTVGQ